MSRTGEDKQRAQQRRAPEWDEAIREDVRLRKTRGKEEETGEKEREGGVRSIESEYSKVIERLPQAGGSNAQ